MSFLRIRCCANQMFMLAYDPTVDTCLTLKQMLLPLLALSDTRRIVLFSFRPDAADKQQACDVWPDDRKLQEHTVPRCALVFAKVLGLELKDDVAFPPEILSGAAMLMP